MRALVTGANGLVGSHVVRALLRHGHRVEVFVRAGADLAALDGLPVTRHVGDVRDRRALTDAAGGCDVVFHTAVPFRYGTGLDASLHDVATTGTTNVLHAARAAGVDRVVVTSSSVVFGHSTRPRVLDEASGHADPAGQPAYVAAKVAQDVATTRCADDLGVDVVLACPTLAIGPTAASALGPSNAVVLQYLADPWRSTFRGGINLVAVRDVAEGHLLLAESGRPGAHYLLGGENLAWREVHELVADLAGVSPPTWTAGIAAAFLGAAAEEVRASVGGRAPVVTRDQATMVGRWYFYAHDRAAALGYAPGTARAALASTVGWLAASPHVTRETRTTMHLHRDAVAARHADRRADDALTGARS